MDPKQTRSISGWWYRQTSLKNMKVNWNDDSQYMEKEKMIQTTKPTENFDFNFGNSITRHTIPKYFPNKHADDFRIVYDIGCITHQISSFDNDQ